MSTVVIQGLSSACYLVGNHIMEVDLLSPLEWRASANSGCGPRLSALATASVCLWLVIGWRLPANTRDDKSTKIRKHGVGKTLQYWCQEKSYGWVLICATRSQASTCFSILMGRNVVEMQCPPLFKQAIRLFDLLLFMRANVFSWISWDFCIPLRVHFYLPQSRRIQVIKQLQTLSSQNLLKKKNNLFSLIDVTVWHFCRTSWFLEQSSPCFCLINLDF